MTSLGQSWAMPRYLLQAPWMPWRPAWTIFVHHTLNLDPRDWLRDHLDPSLR
jgi:hypothetical protein